MLRTILASQGVKKRREGCERKDTVTHIIGECEALTEGKIEILGRRNIEICEIKHLMRVKDKEMMENWRRTWCEQVVGQGGGSPRPTPNLPTQRKKRRRKKRKRRKEQGARVGAYQILWSRQD